VDASLGVGSLAAVAAVALLAPVLVGLVPGLRVPQVVLLLAGGILIGPQSLGLGTAGDVQVLADVGLGFVFLLAGYELDPRLFGQDAGRRAIGSWFISVVLALGVVAGLEAAGLVHAFVPVALALTTTALGTLLPILREAGLLHGRVGPHLLAAGAVGELFPVVAIAVFLGTQSRFVALISLGCVGLLAGALSLGTRLVRPTGRLATVISLGQHETAQITLRGAILLLLALIAVTGRFHLDAVLGAFLAGVVLRRWAGPTAPALDSKLDAVGYGFFIRFSSSTRAWPWTCTGSPGLRCAWCCSSCSWWRSAACPRWPSTTRCPGGAGGGGPGDGDSAARAGGADRDRRAERDHASGQRVCLRRRRRAHRAAASGTGRRPAPVRAVGRAAGRFRGERDRLTGRRPRSRLVLHPASRSSEPPGEPGIGARRRAHR
jgi:hypothetical protein